MKAKLNFIGPVGRVCALLVACAGFAAASPILYNGGFEIGNMDGWTATGQGAFQSNQDAHSGSYSAGFVAVGELGYIGQDVPTQAAVDYLLQFWLWSDGLTPNEFQVLWNGVSVFDQSDIPAAGWTQYQIDLVASGATSNLTFGGRNDNGGLLLDDVSLAPRSEVLPEPSTLTMGLSSFVLLGIAAYLKKRNAKA